MNLLSLVIWTPILFGLLVLSTGGRRDRLARWLAAMGAIASCMLSLLMFTEFNNSSGGMQFVEMRSWVRTFGINYHLGVDGISMLFVVLNNFTTLLVVAGGKSIQKRVSQYMAVFLIMSGLINGAFTALDAVLFYVFFESMLIPMYLIIGVWGGQRRVYASIKFFLYTLLGSLMMLIALIYLYFQAGHSFEIQSFHDISKIPLAVQITLFFAFFLSFAVKVPMWPLHTWLPDAHVEAPTSGSIVLAAITLKIGAYGFLRFVLPILPDAARELSGGMVALSLIAVLYIGLVALVQSDMKKLVAYSSISHMGFVTLGLFLFSGTELNILAVQGALVQMLSHGFISAGMFFCIGVMYDRMHSRNISDYGGVANKMPIFATFMMLFSMANAGLPGTSGFVGEFMVIMGAVQVNFWYAALAATTMIFGAAYTLWMYKRVIFGDVVSHHVAALSDVNKREFWVLSVLAIAVLGMGLYPQAVVEKMHLSVNDLLQQISHSKL